MTAPQLSIIIPCFNEAAIIGPALERLQPLRRRGAEVIVVDGVSTDDSAARAATLADRILSAPRGRAVQMNAGAVIARGNVLLFLHADCALPREADRLILDGIAAHNRRWGRFDVQLAGTHPLLRVIAFMMNRRSRLTGIATGDQGMFVARDLFIAVGGFPVMPIMEDVALSRTLKSHGAPLCLRECVAASARRWEARGVLRTIVLMWRLRLSYFLGADPADLALLYDGARTRG